MTNAKKELSKILQGRPNVTCANIRLGGDWMDDDELKYFKLKIGYTPEDFNEFLNSIDFYYDSGFGSQELFGYVWFDDGTWLQRFEYDGSECW